MTKRNHSFLRVNVVENAAHDYHDTKPLTYEEMTKRAEEFLHTSQRTSYAGNVVWVYSYGLDIPVLAIIDSDDNGFCAVYSVNHSFNANSYGANGSIETISAYGVDSYTGSRWYAYDISVSPAEIVASAKRLASLN